MLAALLICGTVGAFLSADGNDAAGAHTMAGGKAPQHAGTTTIIKKPVRCCTNSPIWTDYVNAQVAAAHTLAQRPRRGGSVLCPARCRPPLDALPRGDLEQLMNLVLDG